MERLCRVLSSHRSTLIVELERFGAETGTKKRDLVTALLAGDDAETIAAALPWTIESRAELVLDELRGRLGLEPLDRSTP